ncbi:MULTISPECIES: hypothetical protein [Bacillus]|uniref:hypothetical protein n=1 Tax=Bacillus TaxID=1386 RepID=UPI002E1AC68A|nr:hypothetical protein [Bacillus licheniformis]MED4382779.1 hypothetical protein [Bacillus licheniformis]
MGKFKRLIIRYKNQYGRTVGHDTLWRGLDSLIELKRRYGFLNEDLEQVKIDGRVCDLQEVRAELEKHG